MGIEVSMPKKKQDTNMARRLIGMAAPIVGGIYGGPAGAAAGGVLGAKITGASGQDALMAGAQSGLSVAGSDKSAERALSKGPAASVGTPQMGHSDLRGQTLGTDIASNPFSRKLTASQSNPQVAAAEGLNILSTLPAGDPLRQQYTAPLVKMQMLSQRRYG